MPNETILIADDDETILLSISQGLQTAGYSVLEAASGEHAITLCQEIAPDLAILDMSMDELSGLDVAEWLNINLPIPFIFLSGYNDLRTVQAATAAGALGYLVKPVTAQKLVPSVRAALARGKEIRQLRDNEQHLTLAVNNNREISVAIGMLMERHRISQQEAFERIRIAARGQRRKTREIADEIIMHKFDPLPAPEQ